MECDDQLYGSEDPEIGITLEHPTMGQSGPIWRATPLLNFTTAAARIRLGISHFGPRVVGAPGINVVGLRTFLPRRPLLQRKPKLCNRNLRRANSQS